MIGAKAIVDGVEMFECIAGYDWREAFGYAGEPGACNGLDISRVEGATSALHPFHRSDVVEIIGITEGENDGANWRIAGHLRDGRWFYLSAGCDYTGWDCQSSGSVWVADDRDSLIQFGIPADDRDVWGLS